MVFVCYAIKICEINEDWKYDMCTIKLVYYDGLILRESTCFSDDEKHLNYYILQYVLVRKHKFYFTCDEKWQYN